MWECPITTYIDEIISQQMVERENAITLKVSETIGVDVNREELIKALNYDRQQYEKGYADAKAEYEPKWVKVEDRLPEDGEEVIILLKHFYLTQLLLASFDETKARFYRCDRCYGIDEVIAWMPIPKYEGVE